MQTLSPTISPTISKLTNPKATDTEANALPAIAQSAVLKTALAGLDASLNDELDRYRHWQANGQTISYLNPFRPRAVSTQSIWTSPSLSDALSPIEPITDSSTNIQSDHRTIQMPVMPPMGRELAENLPFNISTTELHSYRGQSLDYLDTSEKLSEYNPDQDSPFSQSTHEYTDAQTGLNSQNFTSPMPDDDEILQNFANDYVDQYHEATEPEFTYPIPMEPNNQSALRSLMNPVGIISLLLLLCSSAAIGYLIVDPSGVMKLFKPESRSKSAQLDPKDAGSDINLQNRQQGNDTGLSFSPFTSDKGELANSGKMMITPTNPKTKSSKLSPKASTNTSNLFTPSSVFVPSSPLRTVPSAALPPISTAPLPSALAPLDNSYTPSTPTRRNYEPESSPQTSRRSETTPTVSRASNNSNPNKSVAPAATEYVAPSNSNNAVKYAAPLSSAPAPATSSSYRVVVENSYAATAQQVERDAYVRPSDGQVQMGSYRDANAAQQKIEQLRRQGIPARLE